MAGKPIAMRRKGTLSVGTLCCEAWSGFPAARMPAADMGCATEMRCASDTSDMHAAAQPRRTADMRPTMRRTAEMHPAAAYTVRDSSAHGMRDSAAAKATWTCAPAECVRGSAVAADAMRNSTSASTHSVRGTTAAAATTWAASSVLRVSGTCKNGGQSNDTEDFDF
jgi:hypothetical protein